MNKPSIARAAVWIWILVTFTLLGFVSLDPDYGWHVGMGKYLWENGIPKTDPFSYTMPSYPFVDHEWLLNLIFYAGETLVGKNLLAVVFGLLVTGTLYLVPRIKGWELGVFLAAGILFGRAGVRPQVLDWFLIAVLWRQFEDKTTWAKWRFWWAGIFALWTNLHGGFAIGLLMWLFMNVVRAIEDRDWGREAKNWLAWIASLAATFVNPYGLRIWWEVWMQLSDHQLRQNIAEWQPFVAAIEPSFWFLGVLWAMLAIREIRAKKTVWWRTLTLAVLLVAAISSLRHMAIFAVIACFELPRLFTGFLQDFSRRKYAMERAGQVYTLFLTIGLGVFLLTQFLGFYHHARGSFAYPEKAIAYLKQADVQGNIFSEYGWGGYLIWKYPEKKVFIDGRMPSWRWEAPEGEANMAMEEYKQVIVEAEIEEIFEKYGIDIVLIPRLRAPNLTEEMSSKLSRMLYNLFNFEQSKKIGLHKVLHDLGWEIVYQDVGSVLFQRKR